MKISVVVCTRDRHDIVGQAVESIARCEHPQFDLHVIDQSTSDRTRKIVEEMAQRHHAACPIHYHHLEIAGLARARNAGLRRSDGEIVAVTDDDCLVPSDWLTRIEAAFAQDPQADLLYGQVLVDKSFARSLPRGHYVPKLVFKQPERLCKHGSRGYKVFGMGANMAVRRSLLDRIGGFDEALGVGGPLRASEDFDFAYRTYRAGRAILLLPDVTVLHYGVRSPEQLPDTMRNYGIGDGAFYAKHIRCGDLYALRLFIVRLVAVWGRELTRALRKGNRRRDPYPRALVAGVRESARFAVDKRLRLYRETERARMVETEANPITTLQRQAREGDERSV